MRTVAVAGALDTKGADYRFLIDEIRTAGVAVLAIDFGILADPSFIPDVASADVARAGGGSLAELRASRDKAEAMKVMTKGLAATVSRLYKEGKFDAVCGMGGSSGTAILSAAFRTLPLGVPKLLVSTVAGADVSAYVGSRDIAMMPSIVDIAGINRISRRVYTNAAAAIAAMVKVEHRREHTDRPLIAESMFGNTTPCADRTRKRLEEGGYEVLTFHATGTGGRTMQCLADDGLLDGLLDLTTTELADEVCGGVFSAGRGRVNIGAVHPIPAVLAPGCVDMCNFGAPETVPARYRSRNLYEWNSNVTLMRTNIEENRAIGEMLAETANRCAGPVTVLLPLRGVSMLDSPGGPFWNEEADRACYNALRVCLIPRVRLVEVDANINDPVFADTASSALLEMLERRTARLSA